MDQRTVTLACFLALIGAVCAGLIGGVHYFTEPVILAREWEEKNAALQSFFPTMSRFEEVTIEDERYKSIQRNYQIYDEREALIGDVYELSTKGYGGTIQLLVAYNQETKILTDLSFIGSFSETPGFGSRVKEDEFLTQVLNQPATQLEIDTLSGATITSSAVKQAIEEATDYFLKQTTE